MNGTVPGAVLFRYQREWVTESSIRFPIRQSLLLPTFLLCVLTSPHRDVFRWGHLFQCESPDVPDSAPWTLG